MESTRGEVRPGRGPIVADLLILIGAVAFAVFWIRAWAQSSPTFEEYVWIRPDAEPHAWLLDPAFSLRRWAIPVLGPMSLGVLILLLRPPRPARAELFSRPGLVACLVASGVTLVQWSVAWLFGTLTDSPAWWYVESTVFYGKGAAGMAVAIGWIMLALLGRWRPSSGWRDRAGMVLGVAWILVWVASLTLIFYPRYAPIPDGWPVVIEQTDELAEEGFGPRGRPRNRPRPDAETPAPEAVQPPGEPAPPTVPTGEDP